MQVLLLCHLELKAYLIFLTLSLYPFQSVCLSIYPPTYLPTYLSSYLPLGDITITAYDSLNLQTYSLSSLFDLK